MEEFDAFPTGKERKEVVADNKDGISSFKRVGKSLINVDEHYTILDSNISGSESFENSFKYVLPEPVDLKYYIQKTLEKRKGEAVGVEFGGVGARLFAGFSRRFFAKTIGVTLVDHREKWNSATVKEDDYKMGHEVLEGDIFDSKTYKSLNKKLDNKKVDLIISRMIKGLEFVPMEPYTASKVLQTWYKLLNEGGVMFVQTPVVFNNLMQKLVEKIQEEFKSSIEIEFKQGIKDNNIHICSVFRLHKLDGAPDELPMLDHKTVRKTEKYRPFKKII